jgi:hypothetical protein
MFGSDENSLRSTLREMVQRSHNLCNANKIQAAETMQEWISGDARFAAYDPEKLVSRIQECGGSGAHLDLNDSGLMKGGSPRPLSDPRWR